MPIIRFIPLLLLICMASQPLHALELALSGSLSTPGDIDVSRKQNGVRSETTWDGGMGWQAGTEATLASEFMPLRYGLGLGVRSPWKEDDREIVPISIPVWMGLFFGEQSDDELFSPYLATRFGTLAPLGATSNWWHRPLNFNAQVALGARLPWQLSAEVKFDYATVMKTFTGESTRTRISSRSLSLQLAWNFILDRETLFQKEKGAREIEDESTDPGF